MWRLLGYVLAFVAGSAIADAVLSPLAATLFATTGARLIVYSWVSLAGAALAHVVALRWIEKRSWRDVGLGRDALRPRALAGGAAVGALAVGVPALLMLGAGLLRAEPTADGSWWGGAASMLAMLAPAALFEELLLRGYPFLVLREAGGPAVALAVTSSVFGVLHLQNPNATLGSVAIVALAGVFLGSVLLATGSLWAAFAAHLAWNWTLAGLLHAAVSGVPLATPDYQVVDAGPDWLTGGAWGPEGGAAAAAGMLLALGWLWRRGRGAAPATLHGSLDGSLDARPDGRGSF
ncbi:CPBP family intramembrane glutamic endopeptidase [Roseisolibacter agri]|uniref:CAAX prenyl protease 2/Lysostaphin resistance protein A-like domain-containing protein n=1 Tax=Roseisolibacter agri TaxID=2014610 RepID=A0AA37V1L0_9BACT|nr:CPBP family intramembrane glutamic endopeptidase [Roseisolibacter agri]GLC26410.1 hypothetical protein rosag_29230 [Roseisolibacter agri]